GPADGCNSGTGGLTGGKVALVRRIPAMRADRSSPILAPSRRARSAVTTRGALRAEVHGSLPGLTPTSTIGATTGPGLEQYMIRIFNHYLSLRVLMLTLLETMVLFQAMVLGFEIRCLNESLPLPLLPAAMFTVVMLLMMPGLGMYQTQAERFRTTIQRLVVAYGLSLMVMSLIYYLFPETYV